MKFFLNPTVNIHYYMASLDTLAEDVVLVIASQVNVSWSLL